MTVYCVICQSWCSNRECLRFIVRTNFSLFFSAQSLLVPLIFSLWMFCFCRYIVLVYFFYWPCCVKLIRGNYNLWHLRFLILLYGRALSIPLIYFFERNLLQGFLYHCFHFNKLMVLALPGGALLCMQQLCIFWHAALHKRRHGTCQHDCKYIAEYINYSVLFIFQQLFCKRFQYKPIEFAIWVRVMCYWWQKLDQSSCANGFQDAAWQCAIHRAR